MLKHPIVNIGELRRIVNGLLEHVERVNGPELRLEQDYYWDLNAGVVYDMTKTVDDLGEIGSLGDSWEFLMGLSTCDIPRDGPSLMLIHVAPLLRYIGEKVGS